MKFIHSLLLILFATGITFGQSNKFQTAYFKLEEYKADGLKDTDMLLDALAAIEETAKNESQALKPKTWYYKGLINHLVYENEEIASQHPDALFIASEAYQKALSIEDKKFSDEKNTKANLYNLSLQVQNEGAKLYNLGSYERAYKYFTEVKNLKKFFDSISYEKSVDDADATFFGAVCLYNLEKKDEAKKLLNELIEMKYDNPAVYQLLAGFYTEEKNYPKAYEILALGIAVYPNNVGLIIDELNLFLKEDRGAEALAKMEKAVEIDPNNAQLYFALGDAYTRVKDNTKAENAYQKAIEVDPAYFNAYFNLGALYYNEGIIIHKELSENLKLTDKQHKDLTQKRNDLYNKTLPLYEKAHELNSEDVQLMRALKEIYARLEMYDKSKAIQGKIDKLTGSR